MIAPIVWDYLPADFKLILWKGNNDDIKDAPAVINPETQISIFKLELSDNDRRQLIEGNPLYLAIRGKVTPFTLSANLAEITEVARR